MGPRYFALLMAFTAPGATALLGARPQRGPGSTPRARAFGPAGSVGPFRSHNADSPHSGLPYREPFPDGSAPLPPPFDLEVEAIRQSFSSMRGRRLLSLDQLQAELAHDPQRYANAFMAHLAIFSLGQFRVTKETTQLALQMLGDSAPLVGPTAGALQGGMNASLHVNRNPSGRMGLPRLAAAGFNGILGRSPAIPAEALPQTRHPALGLWHINTGALNLSTLQDIARR